MKHIIAAILAGASMAILAGSVTAQELGDARRGQNLAETVCAECHAVQKGALRSRNDHAPTFETIATTRGMTPMALRVALRTSHREMPNLVLKNEEVDDVIAYLATLK
jgi:cytochrome c2